MQLIVHTKGVARKFSDVIYNWIGDTLIVAVDNGGQHRIIAAFSPHYYEWVEIK